MTYQLRPGLSFGFIGERAVLLDLDIDRYFLIKAEAAKALRDLTAGTAEVDTYRRLPRPGGRPLLVEGGNGFDPVEAALPGASVLETEGREPAHLPLHQALRAQLEASASLRILGIKRSIAAWRRVRPVDVGRQFSSETADLACAFASRRGDVPIQRSCVPDSLALIRLLWRKGLDADLYFGVRLDPFAAHCWVQAGDCLLSDPLANVLSFTPVFRL
jgi:hypothetical protein